MFEMSVRSNVVNRLINRFAGHTLLAVVGSTGIGLVFAIQMLPQYGWHRSSMLYLPQWWAWGILTPVIIAVDRRLPFSGKQFDRRALAHLFASVVLTSVYIYIFYALRAALGEISWNQLRFSRHFFLDASGWFLWSGLIYWAIVGLSQAFRYYQRYLHSELQLERAERSLSEARLNALRMQLDPHFLFNALNTISSHVERDPKLTRLMIEQLGDLLRMSLEWKDRQEVPLVEEMAFLEHYLDIQKIRFGDQLRINLDVSPAVRFALVPSLLLQPLVENAIRHGFSHRTTGGTVTVSASQAGDELVIRVLDDGVGLPPGWTLERSAGLGLSATRDRIAGLHPNGEGRIFFRRREGGGTAVEIALPLQVIAEENCVPAAD
jgi:two-component system LytT family sensor kinase